MQFFQDLLPLIDNYVAAYGAAAIFVVVYFESFGAPLPGETGVIAAALARRARRSLDRGRVRSRCSSGAVLGDSTGYLIGRFGGRRLLERFGPYVKLTPERLAAFEAQFATQGLLARDGRALPAGAAAIERPDRRIDEHAVASLRRGAGDRRAAMDGVYALGPYFFAELFHAAR